MIVPEFGDGPGGGGGGGLVHNHAILIYVRKTFVQLHTAFECAPPTHHSLTLLMP